MKRSKMGNLCGNPKGMAMQPPRDLSSLLVEIRVPEDIERSPWAKRFREHLSSVGQTEQEAMFDFVIVCNVLRTKEAEVKQVPRGMKWRLVELNKERRELLKMIGDSFFSENSLTRISLTNQARRDLLCETLSNIKDDASDEELREAFDLVWQARCDYKVWKGGLEDSYNGFVALKPTPPITAVLLSIL